MNSFHSILTILKDFFQFQYYNVWLSLFGFVLCVAIMFLIHWVSSLITFIVILALYLVVVYRKPDVNWGSTTQHQVYKSALTSTLRLQQIDDHVKNYRPQILVLAGTLQNRPPLVDLANLITKHNSLMIVGDVIPVGYYFKKIAFLFCEPCNEILINISSKFRKKSRTRADDE